jgi:hypothetical protein
MSTTENRNRGKEHFAQAVTAIQRINAAEEMKRLLSDQAGEEETEEEFDKLGGQIGQCDITIAKQVDVAFEYFKDAMKFFTAGRKVAGLEGNGQEW